MNTCEGKSGYCATQYCEPFSFLQALFSSQKFGFSDDVKRVPKEKQDGAVIVLALGAVATRKQQQLSASALHGANCGGR